jgi:acyl-CoA synthetase (AMP-forming)/AMP-acid ligase II
MQGLMMDYQLTIDRILEHGCRLYGRKRVCTKLPNGSMHEYTYIDLLKRVKRLANVLESLGVQIGDRVGTFAWNNHEHLELYYAIPGVGAVCHTLNIRLGPDQLAYIINHAEDKVIFVDGTLLPLFERVASLLTTVEHYVLFNVERGVSTTLPNPLFLEELMAGASEDYTWKSTDERMAMGLCYTSGTTGNPKGALYSHRSMVLHTYGANLANSLAIREDDVVLPVVPQFHAMAWGLPYACIMNGADLMMPGPHLQPARLADLIAEYKVTVAAGVPTIWTGLYHELKANPRDISSIRALVVGGAAMPRSLIEAYEKELGVRILHAWGMTEMSPLGTVSVPQSHHQSLPDHAKWDVKARQGYTSTTQGMNCPGMARRWAKCRCVAPGSSTATSRWNVRRSSSRPTDGSAPAMSLPLPTTATWKSPTAPKTLSRAAANGSPASPSKTHSWRTTRSWKPQSSPPPTLAGESARWP